MIILSLDELALLSYLSTNVKQRMEVAIESCMRHGHAEPHIAVPPDRYGFLQFSILIAVASGR